MAIWYSDSSMCDGSSDRPLTVGPLISSQYSITGLYVLVVCTILSVDFLLLIGKTSLLSGSSRFPLSYEVSYTTLNDRK